MDSIPAEQIEAVYQLYQQQQQLQQPKRSVTEDEEEQAQLSPPVAKKREHLWKLTKGKFLLTFHLCKECQELLFHSEDKTVRKGNSVTVKIVLCQDCVTTNTRATDLLAPMKKKE
uniref:DNL-type domain-containing protein n=1 Tax=Globodera pallida TaxID=36090 RepID=A0A183C8E4_GLOPA